MWCLVAEGASLWAMRGVLLLGLTGRWEPTRGLKYAAVVTNGFVDNEQLAPWVLHLADPQGVIEVEDEYAGAGRARRGGTALSV